MIKNALMTFGVSVGACSALIFVALTGCLLFLSFGAVVVRSSQGIVVTPLVFNDGHLMSLDNLDGLKADEISNDLTKNIVLMAYKGAGDLFSFLASSFSAPLTNNPPEMVPFILVRHIMDGSDPSSGFYP
jgi:hypothetical protein